MEYHVNGWANGTVRRNDLARAHEQAVALCDAANALETLTDALSRRPKAELSFDAGGYAHDKLVAAQRALDDLTAELVKHWVEPAIAVELKRVPVEEGA